MQILFSVKSMQMSYRSVPSVFISLQSFQFVIFQLSSVNVIIGKEEVKKDDLRKLSVQNIMFSLM